jgi:hypothetical protein
MALSALALAARLGACFDDAQLPYAVGGALALGAWGAPRATIDVDVSVFVTEHELEPLFDALERGGVMIDRANAARLVPQIGMFKGRFGKMYVDVFVATHSQYDEMKQRRVARALPTGETVWFLSAEDLVLHKLIFGRDKDEADLARLLAVQQKLDLGYVRRWLTRMVPAGDRRFAMLDDLERRFVTRT